MNKLSLFLGLPVCRRSSLLTGEGWARSRIIYDAEKAWSFTNHSIVSAPKSLQHFFFLSFLHSSPFFFSYLTTKIPFLPPTKKKISQLPPPFPFYQYLPPSLLKITSLAPIPFFKSIFLPPPPPSSKSPETFLRLRLTSFYSIYPWVFKPAWNSRVTTAWGLPILKLRRMSTVVFARFSTRHLRKGGARIQNSRVNI